MTNMAILLEIRLKKLIVSKSMVPKKDTFIRKDCKDKLSIDFLKTLEKSLEEEEESIKNLFK